MLLSTPQDSPANQNLLNWSNSEKVVASTAFDGGLKRELHEGMQQARRMASQISEPSDLWELEHYLTKRRKEIDRKYDYVTAHGCFWQALARKPNQ